MCEGLGGVWMWHIPRGEKISDEKYFNVTFSQNIKIKNELHDGKELIECDGESLLNFF